MIVSFEETMLHLRGSEICTLKKKINKKNKKKNIVLMVMMIISYLESPFTQALLGFL